MTMRNLALGALILAVAASAEARLSEGEAAIVGGFIGYSIGKSVATRQDYQPQYHQRNEYYQAPPTVVYPQHHHHNDVYRQPRYNFSPNQYPGVIRVYPDGTTVYSPE